MRRRPSRAARASCSPAASIRCRSNSACSSCRRKRRRCSARRPAASRAASATCAARSPAAPRRAPRRRSRRRRRISAWLRCCKNPFALTPGFEGPKQPPGNKPLLDEDLDSWTAPFVMAIINTRNVHRSNMLMGFPYGKDFVYDEMVLTGAGREGRGQRQARRCGRQRRADRRRQRAEAGRGTVERRARERLLRSAVRRDRA